MPIDFYAASPLVALPTSSPAIRLLSPRYVNAVMVTAAAEVVPICKGGKGAAASVRVVEKVVSNLHAVRFMESIPVNKGGSGVVQAPPSVSGVFGVIHNSLGQVNRSSLKDLEIEWKQLADEFQDSAKQNAKAGSVERPGGALGALSGRDIKEPFWKSCKAKPLAQVMGRIFG